MEDIFTIFRIICLFQKRETITDIIDKKILHPSVSFRASSDKKISLKGDVKQALREMQYLIIVFLPQGNVIFFKFRNQFNKVVIAKQSVVMQAI